VTRETLFGREAILSVLPHRPPFLFVDRVVELEPFKRIVAERRLVADEPFFAGHFPQQPIMPGVLISEALAQTSGLLLGLSRRTAGGDGTVEDGAIFYLAAVNVKFVRPAVPGEILTLCATLERDLGRLSRFNVEASVGRRLTATGSLTLARAEGGA